MRKTNEMIERLVDGDLGDSERMKFLLELDQGKREGWRSLALGFIERDLVTAALREQQALGRKEVRVPLVWVAGIAATLVMGLWLGWAVPRAEIAIDEEAVVASMVEEPIEVEDPLLIQGLDRSMKRVRMNLQDKGYEPRVRGGYISADLRDGSRLIVPVRHIAMESESLRLRD